MEPTTPSPPAAGTRRPFRLPRRRGTVVVAVALSVSIATAAVAATTRHDSGATESGAGQSARLTAGTASTTTTTVPITPPPSCPAATNPPGVPYQVAVKATLTAKLTISGLATHTVALAPHIASDLCGLLLLPGETSTILPANTTFANPTLVEVPTGGQPPIQDDEVNLSLAAPTLASVSPTPAANGGLNLTIKAQVQSDIYLGIPGPGVPNCQDGPVDVTLTTNAPGGQPVTGPLQNATATLVASGFTIPLVTDTSEACSAGVTPPIYGQLINGELNLPNDHTTMTALVHISVSD